MDYEKAWNELKEKLKIEQKEFDDKQGNHTTWEGAYMCRNVHVLMDIKSIENKFK